MKTLIKNGKIINVFIGTVESKNILIEDNKIIGVGKYKDSDADKVIDIKGKYVCPGFIDGHIHIESTTLMPYEFAKAVIPHGTTMVVADPHEIANVCGTKGIDFMLEDSKNLPIKINFMIPSCVPATSFDESFKPLLSKDIEKYYANDRVLGLAEMMNYVGVVNGDKDVLDKINSANNSKVIINGHAPMLTGKDLNTYISYGINDDHECTSFEEGKERIELGQWLMIREGTAAKNLQSLINLFDEPYCRRCLLVTDDKHPADIMQNGHIDSIINKAVSLKKSIITAIQMATIRAAECFGLKHIGAIAPGYVADIVVFDSLKEIKVNKVISDGKIIFEDNKVIDFEKPNIKNGLLKFVKNSINVAKFDESNFDIKTTSKMCRVIEIINGQLLTNESIEHINFSKNDGVDTKNDILKIAVVERHHKTGHIGLGYIKGIGLKKGAIASTVSHDSHNIIVIGTNSKDMACAVENIANIGGGMVVVNNGKMLANMPLPIAGLMGTEDAETMAKLNENVRNAVKKLGVNEGIEPFMNMGFLSLPVIPNIKLTTLGLIDVNKQELVPLNVNEVVEFDD